MDLTQEQIDQLKSLGIDVKDSRPVKVHRHPEVGRDVADEATEGLIPEPQPTPETPQTPAQPTEKSSEKKTSNIFPLLSISGLTILSFGGLVLLKGNSNNQNKMYGQTDVSAPNTSSEITPTQVPKSIQHYLLTSQQYFSQAVQEQSSCNGDSCGRPIELLNNSILAATEAIKEFPQDYRGYQQRGNIYQSLITSKPDLINQSISDFSIAYKLNKSSVEITRTLATLYAKKGDTNKTIFYLNQTVSLEPTKAQNFYDLATIQQQAGYLAQALDTYTKLIPLITDPAQKTAVESQKATIEQIIAKNPAVGARRDSPSIEDNNSSIIDNHDSPTIQASIASSLIIAAPEKDDSIKIANQTDSNSLSGNSILLANQKDITISNTNISSTSQVYVTATKGGKNQNLQVLSKSDKSFTIGLDSPINEDIQFKWWIIN